MEPSKRSTRPRSRQMPRVEARFSSFSFCGIARRCAGDGRGRKCADLGVNVLGAAVGVEEVAGNVNDRVAVPGHAQTVLVGDGGNDDSLDVLLCSGRDEGVGVLCADNDSHALLRLGDRQFGAVQTVVLLRNGVQVDVKAVGQLADGDRYAARAEVVAAADHAGNIAVAEQALDLALLGPGCPSAPQRRRSRATPRCASWRSR